MMLTVVNKDGNGSGAGGESVRASAEFGVASQPGLSAAIYDCIQVATDAGTRFLISRPPPLTRETAAPPSSPGPRALNNPFRRTGLRPNRRRRRPSLAPSGSA